MSRLIGYLDTMLLILASSLPEFRHLGLVLMIGLVAVTGNYCRVLAPARYV